MPFTLQDLLNAGLPATGTDGNDAIASTQFSRTLTDQEWLTYLSIAAPDQAKQLAARTATKNIPNWATWTQDQFTAWCDNNLMSDAAIDATTLSAGLKANLKGNNAFVRNAGKILIALRDQVWPDLMK